LICCTKLILFATRERKGKALGEEIKRGSFIGYKSTGGVPVAWGGGEDKNERKSSSCFAGRLFCGLAIFMLSERGTLLERNAGEELRGGVWERNGTGEEVWGGVVLLREEEREEGRGREADVEGELERAFLGGEVEKPW
jgi:hypothetical protein